MPKHFVIVFVLIVAFCSEALGGNRQFECPETPSDDQEVKQIAGAFFKSASQAFQNRTYNKALRLFVSSLCIADHPNTVYNIAHTAATAKNKKKSLKVLKAYVEGRPEAASALEIKRIIVRLEVKLGAEPSYGESELEEPPAPGFQEEDEEPPSLEEPLPPSFVEEDSLESDSGGDGGDGLILGQTKMRFSSFVLMGTGGAILITGAILQAFSYAAKKNADNTDDFDAFHEEEDRRKNLQVGAVVCFVAGGVAAATGLVLFFVDRKKNAKVDDKVAVWPTGTGLVVSGTF